MKASLRKLAISTLIFAATALVGPALRWATWPPARSEGISSTSTGTFVSDLLFLIWPTQSLAVIEVSAGKLLAAVVSVGTNILVFAFLGMIAGALVGRRWGLFPLYLATGALLVLFASWGAGFSFAYFNVPALVMGLLLYATPFYLTARLV
ncbi:MAG: hypothetical protein H0X13_15215 [Ramlibacter sp.]|nr:hypothetical protein [Ramlibacter sp.]